MASDWWTALVDQYQSWGVNGQVNTASPQYVFQGSMSMHQLLVHSTAVAFGQTGLSPVGTPHEGHHRPVEHSTSRVPHAPRSDVALFGAQSAWVMWTSEEARVASQLQYSPNPHVYPASPPGDFVCTVCLQSFARRYNLVRHRQTHTKRERFACQGGCGKTFTRKDALQRHQVSCFPSERTTADWVQVTKNCGLEEECSETT